MDLIHFKVYHRTGKVQGVFFRVSTQEEARNLGLRGWCHNHPDSSVEGVAVGPPDKMKSFRAFLEKGPSGATVKTVEIIQENTNASDEQIKQALSGGGEDYEVRHYKGQ